MTKNAKKLLLMVAFMIIWLPTGPTDVFVIPFIVDIVGINTYILLSIVFTFLIYKWIEGKTIVDKFHTIERELRTVF